MNRTRYILRAVFFLLAVALLMNLNRKTGDRTGTIAEFKLKMIEKVRTDSLDTKHKVDLLLNETTKFMDDSAHVREGIHYLMELFGLWIAIELCFLVLEKRNQRRQEIE